MSEEPTKANTKPVIFRPVPEKCYIDFQKWIGKSLWTLREGFNLVLCTPRDRWNENDPFTYDSIMFLDPTKNLYGYEIRLLLEQLKKNRLTVCTTLSALEKSELVRVVPECQISDAKCSLNIVTEREADPISGACDISKIVLGSGAGAPSLGNIAEISLQGKLPHWKEQSQAEARLRERREQGLTGSPPTTLTARPDSPFRLEKEAGMKLSDVIRKTWKNGKGTDFVDKLEFLLVAAQCIDIPEVFRPLLAGGMLTEQTDRTDELQVKRRLPQPQDTVIKFSISDSNIAFKGYCGGRQIAEYDFDLNTQQGKFIEGLCTHPEGITLRVLAEKIYPEKMSKALKHLRDNCLEPVRKRFEKIGLHPDVLPLWGEASFDTEIKLLVKRGDGHKSLILDLHTAPEKARPPLMEHDGSVAPKFDPDDPFYADADGIWK